MMIPPKDALYQHLKSCILTTVLPAGQDLDEVRLSEQFGLSRTPLREVFRQLAGEGYLILRENKGARVSDLAHTTLHEFFLVAPMIYAAVLRLAAQNASLPQIDALKEAQRIFKRSLDQGDAAARALANTRFHEITGDMAGNTYLLPSFHRLLIDHARISMTFYQPHANAMADNVTEASEQHDGIIAAIEARDSPAAAALAEAHWNLSKHQIELFVMPAGLDVRLGSAS